jgi:hypothetical protein
MPQFAADFGFATELDTALSLARETSPPAPLPAGRGEAEARSERPSIRQLATGFGCAGQRRSAPGLRWRWGGRRYMSQRPSDMDRRTSRPAGRPAEGVQLPPEGVQPYAPTRRGRGEAGARSERSGMPQVAADFTLGLLAGVWRAGHGAKASEDRHTCKCRLGARVAQGDVGAWRAGAQKSRREVAGGDGRWPVLAGYPCSAWPTFTDPLRTR